MNHVQRWVHWIVLLPFLGSFAAQAQVLPEAVASLKIPLAAEPTSRPMTVAYLPDYNRYVVADGGLAPMPDGFGYPMSKSEVHLYSDKGEHLQSVKPGLDNRSIYFNSKSGRLETVTYNISTGAGMTPGAGIYAIKLDDTGKLTDKTDEVIGSNPAFGSASTMPSYNAQLDCYYAKQERSNKVLVVSIKDRAPIGEIVLDLESAGARTDEVSEHFVAYTGIPGEELALLDIDHKAILVFDIRGKFVGKSVLPRSMKLRAKNHYNGLGYANGMFFVYHEPEGEFGTYYGFRVLTQAQ